MQCHFQRVLQLRMWAFSRPASSYRNLKHLVGFMQFTTAARAPRRWTGWQNLTAPSLQCQQPFLVSSPLPSPAKLLWSIYSSYCLFASAQQETAPINSSEHFYCVMKKRLKRKQRKMDLVKTSHNLICQRNKWEEQEEYPRPYPAVFYLPQPFTTGSLRAASACDWGRSGQRNSIYLKFTSYKRISYINALLGKLCLPLSQDLSTPARWCGV